MFNELRHAVRNLTRANRFALASVFTLAFAFAGAATLLNLLEAFVFRRLPVTEPNRLIGIYPSSGEYSVGFSPPVLQALMDRQQVLTGVCGVTAGYGTLSVQFDSGVARQRAVEAVTSNCYELLGITASIGRVIAPAEGSLARDAAPVAAISDRVWREEFRASPDVLGRTLRLEGTPLTIIGVLPANYRGINADEAPDIALPITLPWKLKLHPPLAMHAIGRLRRGVSFDEAAAHLASIWPEISRVGQVASTQEGSVPDLRVVSAASGFSVLRERYRRPLFALISLAGCLLLLACVNTGGLSLARALDRRDAFAVQLALGAGRARLALQVLWEALLLAAAATLIAVPIAWWAAQLAAHSLWTGVRPSTFQATPLATTLLITVAMGLVAAVLVATPSVMALFVQPWDLCARSVGHGARSGHHRVVFAVQVGLWFMLAFCAALFTSHLSGLRQLPIGYEPARLQLVRLYWTSRTTSAPTIGYIDTLLSELEALPGVELAAMSQGRFGTTGQSFDTLAVRSGSADDHVDAFMDRTSPGFFRTTSILMQQGRDFTWNDVSSGATVAILNQSLAERLFPEGDAVGRTIRFGRTDQVASVIGIVGNSTPGDPRIQDLPQFYLPLRPDAPPAPALLLRLRGDSVAEPALRELVEPFGRHEVIRVSTMQETIDRFLVHERLITSASLLFAALAGIVSIAGLYAGLSQNVTRRTREIGIRLAVGATPNMVRALVVRDVCWILVIGVGLGVPGALASQRFARPLLTGASTESTTLLVMTAAAVVAGVLLVSAWPAQRAARTPVATALRSD